jgi:hypothetical protein
MNISHEKVWNPHFGQASTLFFPIMPYGGHFSKFEKWPTIDCLNQWKPRHVRSFLSHNISFVLQKGMRGEKCFERLYEPRIFLQGEVNTREHSWHDFFNALIWFAFPKIKATLNMRQFIAYDEHCAFPWKTPNPSRTREQDLLTMFDEGGCILVHFTKGTSAHVPFLFGHGFYERIYYGDKDLSACTLSISLDMESPSLFQGKVQISTEILSALDEKASHLLADRTFYKKKDAFQSVHLNQFLMRLNEIKHSHHLISETQQHSQTETICDPEF